MRIVRHLILVAALVLAGAACSGSDDGGAITPTGGTTPPTVDADITGSAANVWSPTEFEAAVGDTVTWSWEGLHNVVAEDGSFDSGEAENGGTFEHTFDTAGSFDYMCEIHGAGMSGTVIVA